MGSDSFVAVLKKSSKFNVNLLYFQPVVAIESFGKG